MLNVQMHGSTSASSGFVKSLKILNKFQNQNKQNGCSCYPRPILEPLKIPSKLKSKIMGCASSQASTVTVQGAEGNGEAPTLPPDYNTVTEKENTSSTEDTSTETAKYPRAEAFEIPLDDQIDMNESIIRKHPPKRLQRLTENSVQPTSIEDLEEKLAKAEIRRQKYLQQRMEGTYSATGTKILEGDDAENDDNVGGGDEGNENDNVKIKNLKNLKKSENNEDFDIEETRNRDWIRSD